MRPAALEVSEQPFAIPDRQVLLLGEERPSPFERLTVATFEVVAPRGQVQTGSLAPHLAHRRLGMFLEARLAPVDVVEAPRDLPHEFDVGHLVGTHGDLAGAIDQDIGGLQDGIAEEAVGRQVPVVQLLLLLLVGRYPLEPAHRRDHRQQEVQFGVFGYATLHEDRGGSGADPGGEPVDHHVERVLLDDARVLVVGGERVPVGDEEEGLVLVLQLHPVLQGAVVVANVHAARGPHSRYNPPIRVDTAQVNGIPVNARNGL